MTKKIYVIQAENGAIKIGLSGCPVDRLATIRTHSPIPVRLIAILGPGDNQDEVGLHRAMDCCRVHGEWFLGPRADQFALSVIGVGLDAVEPWGTRAWTNYADMNSRRATARIEGLKRAKLAGRSRQDRIEFASNWNGAIAEAKRLHPALPWEGIYPIAKAIFDERHGSAPDPQEAA